MIEAEQDMSTARASDNAFAFPGERPVLRFAPSPNGELHLGHALSALTNWKLARKLGGRLLLRIEDIDVGRARKAFVEQIFEDLAWLGIEWETPVRHQSEHFADYTSAADKLSRMGLLYPCFASRAEIAAGAQPGAFDPDGAPLYSGLHRTLTPDDVQRRVARGERPAMRLDMAKAMACARALQPNPIVIHMFDGHQRIDERVAEPDRWGDAVIQRKDVPSSYHLAVVIDDALQGVTLVVRGQDLHAATDLHRLLQVLLGLPAPIYHHHRLLLGDDGQKLAKSRRDTSLRHLRDQGRRPEDILGLIGVDGPGWSNVRSHGIASGDPEIG